MCNEESKHGDEYARDNVEVYVFTIAQQQNANKTA